MRNTLVRTPLIVLITLALCPIVQSMGFIGALPSLTGPGTARCVAVDNTSTTVYIVHPQNRVWVVNTSDFSTTNFTLSWPPNISDTVLACSYRNNFLYMTGMRGMMGVVTGDGSTAYLRYDVAGQPLSEFVFPSLTPSLPHSFMRLYSWNHNTTTVSLLDTSPNNSRVDLGYSPIGGSVAPNGIVYFYGANKITRLTEPGLRINTSLSLNFSAGGISPDGLSGYFFGAYGTCGISLRVINMQKFNITNSSNITPPSPSNFCYWTHTQTKVFIDNNFIYLHIYLTQTIYKISRTTLQITDVLAAEQIGTWVFMDGLTSDSGIVGYDIGLHKYSSVTCPPNSIFANKTCTACETGETPKGPYSPTVCTSCPHGYIGTEPGVCGVCPAGYFANVQGGTTTCTLCGLGSYTNGNEVATSCSPCPVGQYGHEAGFCKACESKMFTNTTGNSQCTLCPRGTFSNQTSCLPCPVGSVGVEPGVCATCPVGESTFSAGNTTCAPCPPGTFKNQTSAYCMPCPNLFYSPGHSDKCFACPPGTHGAGPGAQNCEPCKPGYVSTEQSFSCNTCPPGSFQNGSICSLCPRGTHAPLDGTTECLVCPPGETTADLGQKRCQKCNKGEFSPDGIQCISCNKDIWDSSGLCTPVAQITIGAVLFVVLVSVMGVVFWLWRRRRQRRLRHASGEDALDDDDDDEEFEEDDDDLEGYDED